MEKETINYTDWKTGKEYTRELSSSHPGENRSGVFCPFDGAEIIRWYDQMSNKGYECPACSIPYDSMKGNNQEEVDRVAKNHIQNLEKRLENINEEKERIDFFLDHAKKQGLPGKVTKK